MSRLFTHHDRLVIYRSEPAAPVKEGENTEEMIAPKSFMVYIPHFHKVFGFMALFNILIYVTPLYGVAMDVLGLETLRALAIVHVILALTSFEFRIGRNRSNLLYTIYREMQLHTVIFTLRSYSVMVLAQYFDCTSVLQRAPWLLMWHVLADLATKYFGTATGGTTIRRSTDGGKTSGYKDYNLPARVSIWFFSFSQLVGTYMMLTDNKDSARMAMCVMGPVQVSAFLATLVRKGYFHSSTSFVCYLLMIMPIFFIHTWRPIDLLFLLAVVAIRFYLRISKYTLWISVALIYTYFSGELTAKMSLWQLGSDAVTMATPPAIPALWNFTEAQSFVVQQVKTFTA